MPHQTRQVVVDSATDIVDVTTVFPYTWKINYLDAEWYSRNQTYRYTNKQWSVLIEKKTHQNMYISMVYGKTLTAVSPLLMHRRYYIVLHDVISIYIKCDCISQNFYNKGNGSSPQLRKRRYFLCYLVDDIPAHTLLMALKCIWKVHNWNYCASRNGQCVTNCGPVTPYDVIDLGQHWLR